MHKDEDGDWSNSEYWHDERVAEADARQREREELQSLWREEIKTRRQERFPILGKK